MSPFLEDYIVKNKNMLYRIAYCYVKNQSDALDIVQDSILKAIKNESSLRDRAAVKTWICRIVSHTAIDFIKKNSRNVYVETSDLELLGGSEEDAYENLDIKNALDTLPPFEKTVVVMRFFEDLKIEEVAEVTGENPNTVKTTLYRALKKLKLTLGNI